MSERKGAVSCSPECACVCSSLQTTVLCMAVTTNRRCAKGHQRTTDGKKQCRYEKKEKCGSGGGQEVPLAARIPASLAATRTRASRKRPVLPGEAMCDDGGGGGDGGGGDGGGGGGSGGGDRGGGGGSGGGVGGPAQAVGEIAFPQLASANISGGGGGGGGCPQRRERPPPEKDDRGASG
ncbi:Protein of unknown function [Gryllus bimaculatus]|nr:Protein of unknown function [Gryllus bimaculatus]